MPDDEDLQTRVQVVDHKLARLRDQIAIVAADAGTARARSHASRGSRTAPPA